MIQSIIRLKFSPLVFSAAMLLLAMACGQKSGPETSAPASENSPPSASLAVAPWFEDVAARSGVTFKHSSGHTSRFYMPEMQTGGVGLIDYDNDGLLDILCVNGGSLDPNATDRPGHRLYRNLGNWKFEDVTDRAGLMGHGEYGMGCACGDFDGDGRTDIYLSHTTGGLLYRNNGDGSFTDITTQAGIDGRSWGTSCSFLDYDQDGNLDLVVANYLKWSRETELNCYSRGGQPDYCSPMNYKAPAMATLYRNKGNGTFENATLAAGLDKAYGNGLGVACADFDHDGWIDIFVANDAMPNQLWMNKGNGRFIDEALTRGIAVSAVGMPRAGMGVALVDLKQTGWLDVFVTHLVGEGNGWFVNNGGRFTDTVASRGPNSSSIPLTGFGVGFADFDLDGQLDLYVANGRVKYGPRDLDPADPYAEPNTLLRGLGDGNFEETKPEGGTARPLLHTSRGTALGDLDNDGLMDVVVINRDGPAYLLRNIAPKRGHWAMFRVRDRKGVDALNSAVRIEAGDKVWFRDLIPNQSYCSSNDPRVHLGLGEVSRIDRVIVRWRVGAEEAFGPLNVDQLHEIRESSGTKVSGAFNY